MIKLAIGILLLPVFIMIAVLSLVSFKKGDWQLGAGFLAIFPFLLVTWFLSRRYGIRNTHRLEGLPKKRAVFRNWLIETAPLIFCFGFFGLRSDMTATEAILTYLRLIAIMSVAAVVGFIVINWMTDRISEWRDRRRPASTRRH